MNVLSLTDKPAFPVPAGRDATGDAGGMTMRQYYKAAALTGILMEGVRSNKTAIGEAAELADAMLAEDEKHARK